VTTDAAINDEYLSVIDTGTKQVVQRERFRAAQQEALFLAWPCAPTDSCSSPAAAKTSSTSIATTRRQPIAHRARRHPGAVGGLRRRVGLADDHLLVAAYQNVATVAVIDTTTGWRWAS